MVREKRQHLTPLSPFVIIFLGDIKMNNELITEQRNNTITKANELIQKSRYSLSLQQQKIILYLISTINPYATEFKKSKFKIQDFCKVCGIDYESGKNYTTLKEQIKKIADKSCWVKLENGKETLLRWIEKPYIDENNGTIEIVFDKDMKPFLLQLRENFTQFELSYTLLFKCKYSIRLFELLESYHFEKLQTLEKEIEIEELKQRLDCENYSQFKDFNSRVIKPASAEISEYTQYLLKYEYIKSGRKITAIKFKMELKEILNQMETHSNNEKLFYKNKEV